VHRGGGVGLLERLDRLGQRRPLAVGVQRLPVHRRRPVQAQDGEDGGCDVDQLHERRPAGARRGQPARLAEPGTGGDADVQLRPAVVDLGDALDQQQRLPRRRRHGLDQPAERGVDAGECGGAGPRLGAGVAALEPRLPGVHQVVEADQHQWAAGQQLPRVGGQLVTLADRDAGRGDGQRRRPADDGGAADRGAQRRGLGTEAGRRGVVGDRGDGGLRIGQAGRGQPLLQATVRQRGAGRRHRWDLLRRWLGARIGRRLGGQRHGRQRHRRHRLVGGREPGAVARAERRPAVEHAAGGARGPHRHRADRGALRQRPQRRRRLRVDVVPHQTGDADDDHAVGARPLGRSGGRGRGGDRHGGQQDREDGEQQRPEPAHRGAPSSSR
jgi:hypothetical protein